MASTAPPRHVLAIDDSPELLALYAEMLGEEGYRVTTRRLPVVGHDEVRALDPDLVVLDLMFGEDDLASAFLARFRADPATRGVPVVVCSGDDRQLDAFGPRLRGWGYGVVEKPFDVDVFLAAVAGGLAAAEPRRAGTRDGERTAD